MPLVRKVTLRPGVLVPALIVGLLALNQAFAVATVDADVQATVDNLGAAWGVIKTAAVAILGFLMAIALLKKGYRRAT